MAIVHQKIKTVRGIASEIKVKVIDKKQTTRVVINLDDWKGNIDDIVKQLTEKPIQGLEQVIVVKNGVVKTYHTSALDL